MMASNASPPRKPDPMLDVRINVIERGHTSVVGMSGPSVYRVAEPHGAVGLLAELRDKTYEGVWEVAWRPVWEELTQAP